MTKKILITGASGGFGKLTVLTLLEKGHHVAASMRDINGKNENVAEELRNAGAKVIEIDVTNDSSVTNGVKTTISELDGLDVLINNAGVGVLGMQEFFTTGDFQKVFDINVFGVQRMNREVIPYFRKKQDGLIVYTSSLLGRIALPFYGTYQASKWALEALAENYRVELSGFGIEKAAVLHNFENVLKNNPQQDPQKVADAFASLIEKPKGDKPFRTTVDFIGMADYIQKYNDHLERIMTGLYTNFGTLEMLSVKK